MDRQWHPSTSRPFNFARWGYVCFVRLPFYKELLEIIPATPLKAIGTGKVQRATFKCSMNELFTSGLFREVQMESDYQFQLRFCKIEHKRQQVDFFPPGIKIKINEKECKIPNGDCEDYSTLDFSGTSDPINVTPLIKIDPRITNYISLQWTFLTGDENPQYAFGLYVVRKQSSRDLFRHLTNRGFIAEVYTRDRIRYMLQNKDLDASVTTLTASLLCPLSKTRMETPCRSVSCDHIQCFDAYVYLKMNEKKATWMCPICSKRILYENIAIDGYFFNVITSKALPPNAESVKLSNDGSWSVPSSEEFENCGVTEAISVDDDGDGDDDEHEDDDLPE